MADTTGKWAKQDPAQAAAAVQAAVAVDFDGTPSKVWPQDGLAIQVEDSIPWATEDLYDMLM